MPANVKKKHKPAPAFLSRIAENLQIKGDMNLESDINPYWSSKYRTVFSFYASQTLHNKNISMEIFLS